MGTVNDELSIGTCLGGVLSRLQEFHFFPTREATMGHSAIGTDSHASPFDVRADDSDEQDDKGRGTSDVRERLLENRTLQLFGAVTSKVAHRLIGELLLLEAEDPDKPITVVQNSPGGSVSDGLAIYDTMRFVRPRVRVVCVGLTASIATITLLGAEKEDRITLPHTRLLIHQPLIAGNIFGPASDLEIAAQEILKTRSRLNTLLAEATGQPLERVERDTQRDYWMTAEEALEYGLVARIVKSHADLD